jgi:K(+)-stimulated pyrophosphate-energized sodium pump
MLFVGGMIPVVFSALAAEFCWKAAMDMVYEVRRQFRNSRNYGRNWKTRIWNVSFHQAALREMMLPGILTLVFQ